MESVVYSIVGFLLATGLLVTLHEWGHYCIGRLFDVKVLSFSIGFGRNLWSRRYGPDQTEWKLSALPLGGYVRFLSERDETHPVPPEEKHRAFESKKPWQKIAIVAAGPLTNLLVAVVVYTLVFSIGIEQDRARFAVPAPQSVLSKSGLHETGELIGWNNQPILSFQDFQWQWFKQIGHASGMMYFKVKTSKGEIKTIEVNRALLPQKEDFGAWLQVLGIEPYMPSIPPVVGELIPDYPAALAGFKSGDRLLEVNGKSIKEWKDVTELIQPQAGHSINIVYSREGAKHTAQLTPIGVLDGRQKMVGRIGIAPQKIKLDRDQYHVLVRYPFLQAIQHGFYKTYELSSMTITALYKMLTGQLSLSNISGPVTMADIAGQSLQAGWIVYLNYLALISVSLGVMNLLPIPVLDGGHIVYETLAIIRGGKPVSLEWVILGQKVGFALLGALMLLAFYNDFHRFIK